MQTESTDEPIKATYIPQEYTQPVIVRTNIYAYENGYAVYPVILGKGSIKQINNKIFQIVQNYLSMYGKYINDMDFDVMYNDMEYCRLLYTVMAMTRTTRDIFR